MSTFNILSFTTIILFLVISSTSACNRYDKRAHLAFKHSFPSNSFPKSWTSIADCCFWDYVRCSKRNGRVTTLSIYDNKNLNGTIPSSIASLPFLDSLALRSLPNLRGPIPPQLTKLKKLQFLTIYNTKVSGPVPDFLSKLTNLKELVLINNRFIGYIPLSLIPLSLDELHNLTVLNLSGIKIQGVLSAFLDYNELEDIDLSNNLLTGDIPNSFDGGKFRNINLSNNKLTGDFTWVLFGKTKPVNQIILANNSITFNLSVVQYPEDLQYLDISHNKIYGSILDGITQLPNLGYLDVSYNDLCGNIPSGGMIRQFAAQFYQHNKCLCGKPMPPCK